MGGRNSAKYRRLKAVCRLGVAGDAVSRIGARAVSSLAFGAALALLARESTVDDFGVFMLTYSVGLVLGIVFGLGAPTRILRLDGDEQHVPVALFVVSTSSLVTAFLVVGGVAHVLFAASTVVSGLMLAFGDSLVNFAVSLTTAINRNAVANALVMGHRLVPLTAVAASYLHHGPLSFTVLAVVLSVPVIVGIVVPLVVLAPRSATNHQWRTPFSGGLGYWAYSLSALLGQLQIPLLGVVAPTSTVAMFAMGSRMVGPVSIVTASVSVVLVPEFVRRNSTPEAFNRLFSRLLLLAGGYLVVVAAAAWPAAELVIMIVGPQYDQAKPILIGAMLGAGISGCAQAFNTRLLALGRPLASTRAILGGGMVALAGLLVIGAAAKAEFLSFVPIVSELVVLGLIARSSSAVRVEDVGRPGQTCA